MTRRAVALVSGGLDSAVTLAIAQHEGFTVSALTFVYGQRHAIEIERAKAVCAAAGVTDHRIGLTSYRLDEVLDGDLDEFIDRLILAEQMERLKQVGVN